MQKFFKGKEENEENIMPCPKNRIIWTNVLVFLFE